MFHEPPKAFIYSAYRIETTHTSIDGSSISGSATGFILEIKKSTPYIITNRHVIDLNYRRVDNKYKDYKLTDLKITGRRSDDTVYTFRLHPDAGFYLHSNSENDLVIIQANIYYDNPAEFSKGFHWHFGMEHLPPPSFFESQLLPFDIVCYSGFPDQHDKFGNRPILRSGRISSDPKYDYSWDKTHHGSCVAYEGFSFSGSSGSPVFAPPRGLPSIPDSRHGFLVGVNAGHVPNHPSGHSGISYFYKSSVIQEIISQNHLGGS